MQTTPSISFVVNDVLNLKSFQKSQVLWCYSWSSGLFKEKKDPAKQEFSSKS